jgi:hypothetical protein
MPAFSNGFMSHGGLTTPRGGSPTPPTANPPSAGKLSALDDVPADEDRPDLVSNNAQSGDGMRLRDAVQPTRYASLGEDTAQQGGTMELLIR